MSKYYRLLGVAVLVSLVLFCSGCSIGAAVGTIFSLLEERVNIQADGLDGEIQIKQWIGLHGYGANVFYCKGTQKTHIGEIEQGEYGETGIMDKCFSAVADGNTVTLRWKVVSRTGETEWKEKNFVLSPDDERS